ncbi:MAG: protein translocase subunit SecD [Halanaerobiales bacterium]
MLKRKSKFNFIFIAIFIVIGVFLSVAQFNVPWTNYTYNGFANSIKLGIDLRGGVLAVYNVERSEDSENFDREVDATIDRLQGILTDEGYTEATVVRQGSGFDSQIRVEVPDVDDPEEIFDLIGEPAELEIKKEESEDAEAILTGDDIDEIEPTYQEGKYGVMVDFTDEGSKEFFDLTSELSEEQGQLYMYVGGELFSKPQVQNVISDGRTFISGSMSSMEEAEEYSMKLISGTFDVELSLSESSVTSATLGQNALELGLIAGAIGLVAIFIFMYMIYGVLGLMADISLSVYMVLLMFFLQAVPLVQLTLPGIAGIILSLGMAVDANVIIFERIKEEYKEGKKIPGSVKTGFSKATSAIVDANITTIIASFILYFLGTGPVKGFAITLLIGIFISMFCALLVTRWLVKSYLPLNSINPKPLKLTRGEDNEIV